MEWNENQSFGIFKHENLIGLTLKLTKVAVFADRDNICVDISRSDKTIVADAKFDIVHII